VLDAVERLAADRGVTIGLALDEFQEVTRFGGEDAEWHLRGVVQHHRHVAYVFAGSRVALIRRMVSPQRAFFELCDVLPFGPIDAPHLAHWVERRMREAGVGATGVGAYVVERAGPATRDAVQLARATFDRAASAGVARREDVDAAFAELVDTRDDEFRAFWAGLTPAQQNVLRAVAVHGTGLTQGGTIARFALPTSAGVVKALDRFAEEGRLVRGDAGAYAFDSPYLRAWVTAVTLPTWACSNQYAAQSVRRHAGHRRALATYPDIASTSGSHMSDRLADLTAAVACATRALPPWTLALCAAGLHDLTPRRRTRGAVGRGGRPPSVTRRVARPASAPCRTCKLLALAAAVPCGERQRPGRDRRRHHRAPYGLDPTALISAS
jgi:hypothetical protein